MTTHLSGRLGWHDRGWDGRVCDAPDLNPHCIVHQHIRGARDDERVRKCAGAAVADLDGWLPPCSRDFAAYGDGGFVTVHRDPLEFRQLPSVLEDIPPYSSCRAPYRWMREEFFQEVCGDGAGGRGVLQRGGLGRWESAACAVMALGRENRGLAAADAQRHPAKARMAAKLATDAGRKRYAERKWLLEAPNEWMRQSSASASSACAA